MAFKRKRVFAPRRSVFKRRKLNGRSRARSRTKSWTTNTGGGTTFGYRSKKLRSRAWRRHLWNKTLADTHFRSAAAGTFAPASSTTLGVGSINTLHPGFIGAPGPTTAFWTTAGGLQVPDIGSSGITFSPGDLTIRGGVVGITVSCPDSIVDDINVTIYSIWAKNRPDTAVLPNNLNYGASPDIDPDFTRVYGRIFSKREATMNYNNPSITVVHRLRPQKIDKEVFGTQLGGFIKFIVVTTNMIDTTQNTLSGIVWHNLSFAGDVITGTD